MVVAIQGAIEQVVRNTAKYRAPYNIISVISCTEYRSHHTHRESNRDGDEKKIANGCHSRPKHQEETSLPPSVTEKGSDHGGNEGQNIS